MKFMSADQLHSKIDAKPVWALADLLNVLEKEFDVSIQVVGRAEPERVNGKSIANDPDVRRAIEASREDRKTGQVYSGQSAMDVLRKMNKENQDGANA